MFYKKEFKMTIKIALSVLMLGLFAAPAIADDNFNKYSNDELMNMKSEARNWDQEKRDAYQSERQSRMKSMNKEERQEMKGSGKGQKMERRMENADKGQGEMKRMQKRDGSGGNHANRSGMGSGSGMGSSGRGR
jgi:hypothetical protein